MRINASSFSASADKAVIMGGSAGANLACAITLSLVDEPEIKPRGLIVACSSTIDPKAIPDQLKSFWHPERFLDAAMLNREAMTPCLGMSFLLAEILICSDYSNSFIEAYGASPTEPLYSILLHPSLSKLPKTWLVACSKDPTYDEMLMFHHRLQQEGVDVQLEICKGYPHFFWMLPMLEKSQEFMKMWTDRVREMVSEV
jgi:acetyl esterase/lipase